MGSPGRGWSGALTATFRTPSGWDMLSQGEDEGLTHQHHSAKHVSVSVSYTYNFLKTLIL